MGHSPSNLIVVFISRLHKRPRNSGVVQTSMDIWNVRSGLHETAFCSIVLCTKLPELLRWRRRLSCCRDPSVEGGYGDSYGVGDLPWRSSLFEEFAG